MQPYYLMKGIPECLLTLNYQNQRLDLVCYRDGSYGILRDGDSVGVWEHFEDRECVTTLAVMAGLLSDDATPVTHVETHNLLAKMTLDGVPCPN